MRACLALVAVLFAAGVPGAALAVAQQPEGSAVAASPAQIKQELEKIKKGRTLGLNPAVGTDEAGGATQLQLDNPSPFNLVVLLVGPTTRRIDLGPQSMETLTVGPGDYEIAVTVTGRPLPPFYGKQTIVASMRFRHQFVIPLI